MDIRDGGSALGFCGGFIVTEDPQGSLMDSEIFLSERKEVEGALPLSEEWTYILANTEQEDIDG